MSQKVQILRLLVEQRLTAAAEEIFGLFEKTIAEYEEELCRTKEENQRQILESVWNPTVLTHKTAIQQLSVLKEVPPEQQEWNPIVDQEEPEPEPPHIKEEQEELWTSQEVNITKFPSTPVPVKSEDDDEETVKSLLFYQTQTDENKVEANEVDCGGSEPSSSFHPHRHLQRKTHEQNEDCEETEESDEDQTLNHKPESKLPTNSSTEQTETETDGDDGGGSEPDINLVYLGSVKGRTFDSKNLLEEHMNAHTGQKLVGSSECEATFFQKKYMTQATNSPRDTMTKNGFSLSDVEYEKKLFHCSVCAKVFCWKSHLEIHMLSHIAEKPFRSSQSHKSIRQRSNAKRHVRVHTGKKTSDCSVCGKRCTCNSTLTGYVKDSSGEKPFCCSECGKKFTRKTSLRYHMRIHTGEKPFSCSECGKKFTWKMGLERHKRIHTGERPYSCVVCQQCFTLKHHLQGHLKLHTREQTEFQIHRNQTNRDMKNDNIGLF